MLYTMIQVCKETNMTYQALKFYCNEGLVPNVKRDRNNRRVFDERDVAWIGSLICLKKCGMSIQEMKEYLALCLQGEATIPQRKINKLRLLRKPRFVYLLGSFIYIYLFAMAGAMEPPAQTPPHTAGWLRPSSAA